jgi:predicted nucleic acid-binding protein
MAKKKPGKPPSGSTWLVMVDSGPLLALFNRSDAWHATTVKWLRDHSGARLTTTWSAATEVCALLARRISNDAALDFLRWANRGGIEIDVPTTGSLAEILAISERFSDLPFDLADASIAEAAGRLGIVQVLTIDSDFDVYRDRQGRKLVNAFTAPRS